MRDPNRHLAFAFEVQGVGSLEAARLRFGEIAKLVQHVKTSGGLEFARRVAGAVLLDAEGEPVTEAIVARLSADTLNDFAELCVAHYEAVTRQKTYEQTPSDQGTRIKAAYGDFLLERSPDEAPADYFHRLFSQYVENSDSLSGRSSAALRAGVSDWAEKFRGPMASGRGMTSHFEAGSAIGRRTSSVQPIPDAVPILPEIPSEARRVLNSFDARLTAFRESLHEDDEVRITMTSGLYGETMIARTWDTAGAGLISIEGVLVSGARAEVVQHHSQFGMTLTAIPKPIEGRTFGFVQHAGEPRPE